ncbi:MAG: chemotaxis protein CheB [Rhodanobacteraceae bacterium]
MNIVYEASVDALDAAALHDSGARAVVINLDADMEAHLDHVHQLLDDARYNVIFNDAQVSTHLAGWERARWLRHLVAKILGAGNVDPPRPGEAAATGATADVDMRENILDVEAVIAEQSPPPVELPAEAQAAAIDSALELVPMDETASQDASAGDAPASRPSESWLDPDALAGQASPISRVWVLGASIGGPEAVGVFLAALPAQYPALFLLVQQMGEEFLEQMTQQLALTTALTVRQPRDGDTVANGEVVIMPAGRHLSIDARGRVRLASNIDVGAHASAIDRVVAEMAERFGRRAGAILFSGTLAEAVAGTSHLIAKGGLVYAQDAESCVAGATLDDPASMDHVSFVGSPAELADRLLTMDRREVSEED